MKFNFRKTYPAVENTRMVGKHNSDVFSGGGLVYDRVLEYRVWVKVKEPLCYSFARYSEALEFSKQTKFSELPLVLVEQDEYIKENEVSKKRKLIKKKRITEWEPEWLKGAKRTEKLVQSLLISNDSDD